MGWVYLLFAGAAEIVYAATMPKTMGFTKLAFSLFSIFFIAFPDQPLIALALVIGPLIELPILAIVSQMLLSLRKRSAEKNLQ